MRHTTDLVHIPTTHPSHDIQDTDDTDNRTHLQSLRSAILTHLATALATAAQKIARDAAGDDPFGDNHDLAKRTHSLLQILPNLLPLLPEPDDDDDRDYRHPNADRLMAEIRDEEERQQVLLPECPFCDLPSDHTPENCPANPDGLPAQRAAQLRLKHAELLALHHAHPPRPHPRLIPAPSSQQPRNLRRVRFSGPNRQKGDQTMPSSNTADLDPVPQNSPPFPTSADHTGNPPTPRETPAPPDQPIPDPADALTDRQRPALDLMLLGATDTRIAQELSIDRKTLYNWKTHDPAFRAALTHHRAILHNQATDRFRALLSAALDALDKQVHDRYTPNAFRAARALLSLAQIGRHAAPQQPPQADPLSLLKPRK